jgi:ubiquinone/menaquinone biosynthesis C-methylase UbiE
VRQEHYIIRGGTPGRERLRILSRVFKPTTLAFLKKRAGIQPGMTVLDFACGGGDVTVELAKLVDPTGRVVGTDRDVVQIGLVREEVAARGIANIEFRQIDLLTGEADASYDLIYARFILTHPPDPAACLAEISRVLRPGGVLVVEDIDMAAQFCVPESPVFDRSVFLYVGSARRRGCDANIGRRLHRPHYQRLPARGARWRAEAHPADHLREHRPGRPGRGHLNRGRERIDPERVV